MSNLPELPPPVTRTEQLTVKKAFPAIGAGFFILTHIINCICVVVIFIHLGLTIPALMPYAGAVFFAFVFIIGCYWGILRLAAPERAGNSILEWSSKVQASSNTSDEKISRARRIFFGTTGVLYACGGLTNLLFSRKSPDYSVYKFAFGLLCLSFGAGFICVAYIGRLPTKKGNHDSQSESDEVTPGEYKDDNTTAQ
ncbi:uncharacterized protein EDB91DRAFT_1123670 [Suillus paluster]|uniref:uncharacterized protein n=1 Tax=Suillus paluster TaxID=48578 RepID=UPI001B86CA7C|nr:uncharacterized protein EDB91DRAFT_1123670 [Suillus paluster]KAG1744640.1 hypothetical protein EDB91DRAFT_1123670 [Suillus paluster]